MCLYKKPPCNSDLAHVWTSGRERKGESRISSRGGRRWRGGVARESRESTRIGSRDYFFRGYVRAERLVPRVDSERCGRRSSRKQSPNSQTPESASLIVFAPRAHSYDSGRLKAGRRLLNAEPAFVVNNESSLPPLAPSGALSRNSSSHRTPVDSLVVRARNPMALLADPRCAEGCSCVPNRPTPIVCTELTLFLLA